MSRSAIAVLSTENLLHNVGVLKKNAPGTKVIGMVKANAYGHGLRSVSQRLEGHVDLLGVASIDEALALRKAGVETQIVLIEGVFEPSELIVASTEGFHVVFHEDVQVDWATNLTCPVPLQSWVKVDTGMGRLGFTLDKAPDVFKRLSESPQIRKPIRLMSHFACADEDDQPLNQEQSKAFQSLISSLNTEGSLCNSAAIFRFPQDHHDYIRPGLSLYGASPFPNKTASELGLKPVMTLQSSLIAVKRLAQGSSIGYGARYTCPEDMVVGIVAFGYGDGYPRTTQDGTPLLINNTRCSLVGRVSMDMLAVDLRPCPQAKVGDPVILWGQGLPVEDVACHTNNIAYDLLTGVQNRVKFYWTRHTNK